MVEKKALKRAVSMVVMTVETMAGLMAARMAD